jgi:bacteriorhodopsin
LLIIARATARKRGPAIARFYTAIAAYTVVVWFGYILVWFVFGREGPVGPAYFGFHTGAYAILDVLSKSVFGAWLLFAYAKVPDLAEKLGEGWVDGAADEGRIRIEDGEEEG